MRWRLAWLGCTLALAFVALSGLFSLIPSGVVLAGAVVAFCIGFLWSYQRLEVDGRILHMEDIDAFVSGTDNYGFVDHERKIVYRSRCF